MGSDSYGKWAEDNPRHAWALENMSAGLFPNSIRQQVELDRKLSAKQMQVLWDKADQLERMGLGEIKVPKLHALVDTSITITKAAEFELKNEGGFVYRVSGTAKGGWTCRFDLDPIDRVVELIATRANPEARVRGVVGWVKDAFVVLQANTTQVVLG